MFWKKFVNNLSDKAFASDEFQQSWKVHMNAFGPILEPAFAKDSGNRLNLVAALNTISRNDYKNGKKKLMAIKKACKTNADKAAWAYFMGLLYERTGDRQQMITHYGVCCSYNHGFYLPYLKLAKCAMEEGIPGIAEDNYRKALNCLNDIPAGQADQKPQILASTYGNLAGCLMMMRRYDSAAEMLAKAQRMQPENLSLLSTEAMLHAACGRRGEAMDAIALLEKSNAQLAEGSRRVVDTILDGKNSHYCALPAREDLFEDFWRQFTLEADNLKLLYETDEDAKAARILEKMLAPLFPYPDEPAGFSLKMNAQGQMLLVLTDGYSLSLQEGLKKLLAAAPKELKTGWEFRLEH